MDTKTRLKAATAIAMCVTLSACGGIGSVDLWPFGDGTKAERSRVPANSTTYQCVGGKRFYLRTLDNGAATWVILPEREFRLDRMTGEAGTRYGNGKAVLTIAGDEVSLSDGPTVNYTGCRIPSAEPAKAEPGKAAPKTEPAKPDPSKPDPGRK